MTPTHCQLFELAEYPCYWIDNGDEPFWMNDAARQAALFGGNEAVVQNVLRQAIKEMEGQPTAKLLPVVEKSGIYTLVLMPLKTGVMAVGTKEAKPMAGALSVQLRDPITSIFSVLPLLTKRLEGGDVRYTEEIQNSCYQLLRLTSNLENAYRSSDAYMRTRSVDFCEFMRSIIYTTASVCKDRGIPIKSELYEDVLPVNVNEQRLSEAVLNVIRNSLQYTRDGSEIFIRLRRLGDTAVLTIEDKGLGIRPAHLGHIFDAYFSADPYGDGGPDPGLGLGLFVAQQIVRSFGGSMTAESRFGKGTRITISLPLACEEMTSELESDAADYLLNRYSPVYVQLCGYCRMPDM